jgi:hypothetical protein
MKKFRISITTTCTDEFFAKEAMNMKADVNSGEAKKELYTNEDKKAGIANVEITFEELPL